MRLLSGIDEKKGKMKILILTIALSRVRSFTGCINSQYKVGVKDEFESPLDAIRSTLERWK